MFSLLTRGKYFIISDISDFPVGWEIFPFDDFVYFRWKLTGDVLHFTTKQGWKDGKELGISKFDVTDHGGVVNQSGKFNVNEMELLLQRLDICQVTSFFVLYHTSVSQVL